MEKMFWIDLEMTGLDEKIHHIIEVAVIITDLNFKELATYHRVVYQPQAIMDLMDDWCQKTHGASGLTEAVKTGTDLKTVEKELVALTLQHFPKASGKGKDDKVVLCGNSVGNDKRFLDHYMTDLSRLLSYRIVDVSSFKEVFRSKWKIEPKKGDKHRAVDDIRESIAELQMYLSHVKI